MSEPPAKRPRVEADAANPTILVKCERLWKEDGSIVLLAESTQYKVHKTMLAMHSQIFADMLAISHPNLDRGQLVEGCPIVHLSDPALDVEHFLLALYDWRYFTETKHKPFSMIRSLLILGTKYAVQHFRDEAIRCLTSDFPSTLDAWLANHGKPTTIEHVYSPSLRPQLLSLARQHDVHSIIPTILFRCAASGDSPTTAMDSNPPEVPLPPQLTPEDEITVHRAWRVLFSSQIMHVHAWTDDRIVPSPHCITPSLCPTAKMRVALAILKDLNLQYAFIPVSKCVQVCSKCLEVCVRSHEAGLRAFWEEMPGAFGLEGWESLMGGE